MLGVPKEATATNQFRWRTDKIACMQIMESMHQEIMRMQGKFLADIKIDMMNDLLVKAKQNELTNEDFKNMEELAAINVEGVPKFEKIVNQMKRVIDAHQNSQEKEQTKASEESREPKIVADDADLVNRVTSKINDQDATIKRKKADGSQATQADDQKKAKTNEADSSKSRG